MLCTQIAVPELGYASEGPAILKTSVAEAQEMGAAALSPEQAKASLVLGGPSKGISAGSGSKVQSGAATVQRGRKQSGAQPLSAGAAGATPAAGAGAGAALAEVPHTAALQRVGADHDMAAGADSCRSGKPKAPSAAPHERVLSALAPAAAGAAEAPPACALGKLAWRSAIDQRFKCAGTAYCLLHRVFSLQRSATLQGQQHRSQVANSAWFFQLPP